jgi:cation diffusion facilitator CzcD-associated flavoprotein CzcO
LRRFEPENASPFSLDIRGILGINRDGRNGFDGIKMTHDINADATRDEIEALVAQSQKRSAVFDIVTNPTNVTVEVTSAPVGTHTEVTSVRPRDEGYEVATTRGVWRCRTIVLAAGVCNIPLVPALAEAVPPTIATFTPREYRNPDQLEESGALSAG